MKPIPTLHYVKMYTIASNINPHLGSALGFEIVKILLVVGFCGFVIKIRNNLQNILRRLDRLLRLSCFKLL